MKKILISVLGLAFMAGAVHAQVVNGVTAPFNKDVKPAFAMQLDYSKKLVEEAVDNRFKKDKMKGKSSSGMMVYSKVNCNDLCAQNCTVYTRVDGSGKSATVYLYIERENGNFITIGDQEETCVKNYMISMLDDVKAVELKYQIEEQIKVCEKAEKNYQKLLEQKAKLEKDIEAADKDRQEQNKILSDMQKSAKK